MGKFSDVQVGDTVYLLKPVQISFTRERDFFVDATVVRVTKAQFVVSCAGFEHNTRHLKRDGCRIPHARGTEAYKLGDSLYWGQGKVTNQREERVLLVARIRKFRKLQDIISEASEKIRYTDSADIQALEVAAETLQAIVTKKEA